MSNASRVTPEQALDHLVGIHQALLNLRIEFREWQARDFPLLGFDVVRAWHCVRAAPGMDIRFAGDVHELGYETLQPLTFTKDDSGHGRPPMARLRFSPYVFVAVDYSFQSFHLITEVIGYEDVLRLNFEDVDGIRSPKPSVVPHEVILGMRHDQHDDFEAASRRVRRDESLYRKGDKVRVLRGSFEGHELTVDEARSGSLVLSLGRFPLRVVETDVVPLEQKLLARRAAERALAEREAEEAKLAAAAAQKRGAAA